MTDIYIERADLVYDPHTNCLEYTAPNGGLIDRDDLIRSLQNDDRAVYLTFGLPLPCDAVDASTGQTERMAIVMGLLLPGNWAHCGRCAWGYTLMIASLWQRFIDGPFPWRPTLVDAWDIVTRMGAMTIGEAK